MITDHCSLLWLLNLKDPSGRLSRWALKLQQYSFNIEHRKGKLMVVPDALSRAFSAESEVDEIASISTLSWYNELKAKVIENPDKYGNFRIEDGCLMKHIEGGEDPTRTNWRIVVPKEQRQQILNSNHDKESHFGIKKTLARIKEKYYCPKLAVDVEKYVKNCIDCGETKSGNRIGIPQMGAARTPKIPFEIISVDFKGPFPRSSGGFTNILVVTDHFSKFVLILILRSANTEKTVEFLENEGFLLFGTPNILISDNGSVFKSHKFKALLEKYDVRHMLTPLYHPQANPTGRVNRVIGDSISATRES